MKVSLHNFGNFKLDGGAMFGPVPKPVWEKVYLVDSENRILMASNSLLIEMAERRAIIDVGMGVNFSEKLKERYALEPRSEVLNPETITDVILTHLHFDHTGGIFSIENNQTKATYPNATFHVQKAQWEEAHKPSLKEFNAYNTEDLNFLKNQKLNLIQGATEIIPGVSAQLSNGHTRGLQLIKIKVEETTIVMASDLIPTAQHLNLAYHMSYDLNPEVLIEEKFEFLELVLKNNYLVIFQHDPYFPIGKIVKNGTKYQAIKATI